MTLLVALSVVDDTLTAHSKSGNAPEDQRPENLYANLGEVVTISGMPASKEYIKALQLKRLEQVRPKVKLPKPVNSDHSNLSYLFKELEVAKGPVIDSIAPLAISISTLDDSIPSLASTILCLSDSDNSWEFMRILIKW